LQTLTFDISRSFVEDFGVEVERVREDAEVAEALRDAEALALRRDVQLVVGAAYDPSILMQRSQNWVRVLPLAEKVWGRSYDF
jgi:hypothetical protein